MKRSRIYAAVFIFLSWNVVTYLILNYSHPNRLVEEKKSLDVEIGALQEKLQLQATEHNALLHKLEQAKLEIQEREKEEDGKNEGDETGARIDSTPSLLPLPVLVLACNRISVQRSLDQLLKYRTSAEQFPIIVSQDCGHGPTADIIGSYGYKITHLQQPDLSNIDLPKKEVKFKGYYMIARHYKWALGQIFHKFNFSTAIIVEDDLDISPDFFEYFWATRNILINDPSLWCVSAWNDNGKTDMISDDAELLYRTDFFPGLGWMLERKTWLEMEGKWPKTFWDDWMRHPDQRRDRACIRPEVPRTSTFGRIGVSRGQFFDKHLKFIQHNDKFVPFTKMDLTYLLQENYDEPFVRTVYGSPLMTAVHLLAGEQPNLPAVRIQYRGKENFKSQAKLLGIMDDFKAGVPRTAYRGIISFVFRNRRVYLAPPSDWTGYDLSWN